MSLSVGGNPEMLALIHEQHNKLIKLGRQQLMMQIFFIIIIGILFAFEDILGLFFQPSEHPVFYILIILEMFALSIGAYYMPIQYFRMLNYCQEGITLTNDFLKINYTGEIILYSDIKHITWWIEKGNLLIVLPDKKMYMDFKVKRGPKGLHYPWARKLINGTITLQTTSYLINDEVEFLKRLGDKISFSK